MAANNRIFYACQAVGIKECFKSGDPTMVHGVQSVGITTNFNLEQAFELGMIQIYENIEGLPDVEVTLEKVLDGYPLMYHLASPAPEGVGMISRSKLRSCLSLGIYSDALDGVSGVPPVEVYCSGMYIGNLSYTIPVDGNSTESMTLQGNHKEWLTSGQTITKAITETLSKFDADPQGKGADEPLAYTQASGGIQRRENVRIDKSEFPVAIYGCDGSGIGNGWDSTNKVPKVHFQNLSVSTDFSREDILELGRKVPYYRAAGFPIEVTTEIEAIAISGDFVSAYEAGNPNFWEPTHDDYNLKASGDNTGHEAIRVSLQDGTWLDMGRKNRLSSVSYGGGDATGGNVSISYSYTNFNDLVVLHPQDPYKSSYTAQQKKFIEHTTTDKYEE